MIFSTPATAYAKEANKQIDPHKCSHPAMSPSTRQNNTPSSSSAAAARASSDHDNNDSEEEKWEDSNKPTDICPVTNLHYAALPSSKPINVMHVHQILGIGDHSPKEVKTLIANLKEWKQHVRGWGANHIKMKMVTLARQNKNFTSDIRLNAKEISTFKDIKYW
jgi:hypothetical protein